MVALTVGVPTGGKTPFLDRHGQDDHSTPRLVKVPPRQDQASTVVASTYRTSIMHDSCDTTLWPQLLERDTPLFASRPLDQRCPNWKEPGQPQHTRPRVLHPKPGTTDLAGTLNFAAQSHSHSTGTSQTTGPFLRPQGPGRPSRAVASLHEP